MGTKNVDDNLSAEKIVHHNGLQNDVTLDVVRTAMRAGMTSAALISVMPDIVERMLLSA